MLGLGKPVPEKLLRLVESLRDLPDGWELVGRSFGNTIFRRLKNTNGHATFEYYENSYVSYLEDADDNCITITWGDVGKVTDTYPDIEEID